MHPVHVGQRVGTPTVDAQTNVHAYAANHDPVAHADILGRMLLIAVTSVNCFSDPALQNLRLKIPTPLGLASPGEAASPAGNQEHKGKAAERKARQRAGAAVLTGDPAAGDKQRP